MSISKAMNPDLAKERKNATIDSNEFAAWFYGNEALVDMKRMLENEIYADIDIDPYEHEYLAYEDACTLGVKQTVDAMVKLRKIQERYNLGGNEMAMITGAMGGSLMPAGNVLAVHMLMFTRAFKGQGTPEQYEEFGKRADNFQILGTYAQTELGHGTFLRGLETRADYDRKTQQFVLNTPTLTAYKWWPGGLGQVANYTIVVAQLYIDGDAKGVHLFVVPLRDERTHRPLTGIDVGEIGKKIGFNGVNNGYLGLKNVRVPRTNMLMKNAQVLADGTYIKSPVSQLSYFPMVYVRCTVAISHAIILLNAATIATRYSCVRRQSPINPEEPEPQIIEHMTQQMKVLPEIATGVAYHLAGKHLLQLYNDTSKAINQKDYSRLPELHALACTLKASCSYDATAGIERLRQSCGGHGYLTAANLGNLYMTASAATTYEGENSVLYLQVGRILLKSWAAIKAGERLMPTMVYLSECAALTQFPQWTGSWECMLHALQFAATNKTRIAFESYNARLQQGLTQPEAANRTGIELTQAAELHGRAFVASAFLEEVRAGSGAKRSAQLQQILEQLLELHLVTVVQRCIGDISRFIPITEAQRSELQARLERVLTQVRANAVAICDGFDFHDRTLGSVLGSYDGNVYERIFDSAKRCPMNKQEVPKSFKLYLKPFMRSKL